MPESQQKFEDDFAKLYKAISGGELKGMPSPTAMKKKNEAVSLKKRKKNASDRIREEKRKHSMEVSSQKEPEYEGVIVEVIPDDFDDEVPVNESEKSNNVPAKNNQGKSNDSNRHEQRERKKEHDLPRSDGEKGRAKIQEHEEKSQKEQCFQDKNKDVIDNKTALSEEECLKQPVPLFEIPEHLAPYIEIEDCSKFIIERYYVTKAHMDIRDAIVRNQQMVREFRAIGLNYLNSTMLYGVPGTGKTVMCRWLSYNLHIPFVYINFAKMIDGVFGNTARNITDVFRFLQDKNCIFLIDEIDCVATKRGTESAATGGELSRITITIMQELDRYRRDGAECILLAATNRADMLDAALLSRFSIMHEMKPLNVREKEEYIRKFLDDVHIPYDIANIKDYATTYIQLRQRNVEADIIRCIADWIDFNKIQGIERPYILNHHDEE